MPTERQHEHIFQQWFI